jgi:hypothetical protein
MGIMAPTVDERVTIFNELSADSPAGRTRRVQFQKAITQTSHEFHGLGIEMNQHYVSKAVFGEDETGSNGLDEVDDPVLEYKPSTFPGRRLPHVWLNTAIPSGLISTIDLAGKSSFSLFTGIGGSRWKTAAAAVSEELGVPIRACSIGFGQDYEDVYFDWARVKNIEDSGCILVRPDRVVAWRAAQMDHSGFAQERLRQVMISILCR